jgi:hypothetical protein
MSKRIASSHATVVSQAERDIRARLDDHDLDFSAMSAVSNIYRTGSAIRNHMERELLARYDLSWVAFTVLWVLWIWGEQETGHVAAEANSFVASLIATTGAACPSACPKPVNDSSSECSPSSTDTRLWLSVH